MILSDRFSSEDSGMPWISRLCFPLYCSKSSIWHIAESKSLLRPSRSSFKSATSSSALRTAFLSELTSCFSLSFSASNFSNLSIWNSNEFCSSSCCLRKALFSLRSSSVFRCMVVQCDPNTRQISMLDHVLCSLCNLIWRNFGRAAATGPFNSLPSHDGKTFVRRKRLSLNFSAIYCEAESYTGQTTQKRRRPSWLSPGPLLVMRQRLLLAGFVAQFG